MERGQTGGYPGKASEKIVLNMIRQGLTDDQIEKLLQYYQ